ncbi:MAG: hypothetical protein ACRDNF_13385 [Streptosporangiaceae bacterium]
MIKRITLALAAATTIAGGAVAAPAAHASITQPSCWSRTVKCLAVTPAAAPNLKYQTHYHAPPNLKYQATPDVHYHTGPNQPDNEWGDG